MSLGSALGLSIPAASSVTETAVPVKRFTRRREGGTSAARRLPPSRPAPPCRPPHGADRSAHDRYGTPRRDRMSRRLPDGNDQGSDWRATTARWSSSMRLRSSQQAWANPDVMAPVQRCGGETPKWSASVRFRLIREWRKCTRAPTMSGFALMQCIPAVGKQRPSASIGVSARPDALDHLDGLAPALRKCGRRCREMVPIDAGAPRRSNTLVGCGSLT